MENRADGPGLQQALVTGGQVLQGLAAADQAHAAVGLDQDLGGPATLVCLLYTSDAADE